MQITSKRTHAIQLLDINRYSTTLCLLHRAHMPPATPEGEPGAYSLDAAYPSRNIAFQAAGMITSIIKNLQEHDELRLTPAFMYVTLPNENPYHSCPLVYTAFFRP